MKNGLSKKLVFFTRYLLSAIRTVLTVCILVCGAGLAVGPFLFLGEIETVSALIFYAIFYTIIWGTIPSALALMATVVYHRQTKDKPPALQREVRLLVINIILVIGVILIGVAKHWLITH